MRGEGPARLVALVLASLAVSAPARAQTAPPAPPPAPDADHLAVAKDHFRRGVALFEAGQLDDALEQFRRSRDAFPSKQNTLNIAIALHRLGRADEALEAYEDALAGFSSELTDEERAEVPRVLDELRRRVGVVDVTANVAGSVLIDGRERARLPRSAPLRVMPGSHVLRVLKDGYATFERTIDVAAGRTVKVDAVLVPLAAAGGLRVEDAALPEGALLVDGVAVGTLPWEGTLAPGVHVISARAGDAGSAPTTVTVLQGQTTLVRLRSRALGARARVTVRPASADLRIGGAPVGRGAWEGALPVGSYDVEAREDGYFPKVVRVEVPPRDAPGARAEIVLDVDPNDPRWPKPAIGRFWAGALAGYALGGRLASGAESRCAPACATGGLAAGPLAGLRAGYELTQGISFEAMGGYLTLARDLSRAATQSFPAGSARATVRYDIDDTVRFKGPWIGVAASWRLPLAGRFSLRPRVGGGVVFATSLDPLAVSASAGGQTVRASLQNAGDAVTSAAAFGETELGLEADVVGLRLGAAVALLAIFGGGPPFPHGDLYVPVAGCTTTNPANVGCAPAWPGLRGERAYAPFVSVVPQLAVGRAF